MQFLSKILITSTTRQPHVLSRTATNLIAVFSGDMLSKFLGALTTILLIRILSMQDYGLYTYFLAIMQFIPSCIGIGLNTSCTRYGSEYISRFNRAPTHLYGVNLQFQLLLYIIIVVFISIFSTSLSEHLIGSDRFSSAILIGGFASIGPIILQILSSIFQSSSEFTKYITLQNTRQAILLLATFILWLLYDLSFFTVSLTVLLLQLFLSIGLLMRLKSFFKFGEFTVRNLNTLLASGGLLSLYFSILSLLGQMDILIISRYRTTEELATYGVAFRYYSLFLTALSSIHVVLLPKLAKVEFSSHSIQLDFLRKWIKISSIFSIPILMLILLSNSILSTLNGNKYSGAVPLFKIFCIGLLISLLFSPIINLIIARKDYKFLVVTALIVLIINSFSNYYYVPKSGIMAACVISVTSHAILNLCGFVRVLTS